MKSFDDFRRRQLVVIAKYRAQVMQQANAKARTSVLPEVRYKRYSRYTSSLRPLATGSIGNGNHRLPHVRVTILNFRRQFRPRD